MKPIQLDREAASRGGNIAEVTILLRCAERAEALWWDHEWRLVVDGGRCEEGSWQEAATFRALAKVARKLAYRLNRMADKTESEDG
jgi:hypothetical protein